VQALLDKVRARCDAAALDTFRREAHAYVAGGTPAAAYHAAVVGLGLGPLVPEMAALLTDAPRRNALLAEHRRHYAGGAPGGPAGGWVPPEAAAAGAAHAAATASWRCPACTLVNGPGGGGACEACGRPRGDPAEEAGGAAGGAEAESGRAAARAADGPGAGAGGAAEPSGAAGGEAGGGSGLGSERGKKVRKVPKFERLRLTGGDPDATRSWMDTDGGTRVKPQNAWTQARPAPRSWARRVHLDSAVHCRTTRPLLRQLELSG
jgi:hypothetical protein